MLLPKTLQEYQGLGAGHTATEISQQPNLWQRTLKNLLCERQGIRKFLAANLDPESKIIFTGAGTSEFVGKTLAPYLHSLGSSPKNSLGIGMQRIYSIASTDIVSSPESYIQRGDRVLLVSSARSGNSPESLAAAQLVEDCAASCSHFILACDLAGQLAQAYRDKPNSYIFHLEGANDQGFAMTGSFTSMTLAGALIFQLEALEDFVDALENLDLAVYMRQVSKIIGSLTELQKTRIICLGSAENKGIAQEAHLKMLELSASLNVANFDSPLGFRHGPKSLLNDESIVFFFCSPEPYAALYERDMLRELQDTPGAHHVVAISPYANDLCHTLITHPSISLQCPPGRILHSLLHILAAQVYALQNSIALGVEPDNPSPSGSVNRVVQGVKIYPYSQASKGG